MTVTWHWGFGDPLGARVQRLKYCAHLLAVWHVSAGKGEQLEEGAQKERTVDRWGSHGWRAAALNQSGQSRRSSGKVQRAKSYRRSQRLRWWGEAAAPGSARISILPLSSSPLRVRALCKAALSGFLELHGCRELMTPCSFAAASVISPHRWMNAPPPIPCARSLKSARHGVKLAALTESSSQWCADTVDLCGRSSGNMRGLMRCTSRFRLTVRDLTGAHHSCVSLYI